MNLYDLTSTFRPLIGYDKKEWTSENIDSAIQLVFPELKIGSLDRGSLFRKLEMLKHTIK